MNLTHSHSLKKIACFTARPAHSLKQTTTITAVPLLKYSAHNPLNELVTISIINTVQFLKAC